MSGVVVLEKPVMVDFALFLRDAADNDGSLRRTERIVIDFNGRSGDICAVFAIPASVHVKAVTE